MKHLLLALPLTLGTTLAFGQKIEYSGRANATFSEFRGNTAASNSTVNYNTSDLGTSTTINPYGATLGAGFGASARAQYVSKLNLLAAFDLGYDFMQSRTNINYLNYNNAVASYTRSASGTTQLYTQAITAFAGGGYRLQGKTLALDALVGPELAYIFTAREIGSGSSSNGSWSTDAVRHPDTKVDFRLRGDLTLWVHRVGLAASYSLGFVNYQPVTPNFTDPQANARVMRIGLAYRLK